MLGKWGKGWVGKERTLWTVEGLAIKLAITNTLRAAESFSRFVTLYTKIFLLLSRHMGCPLVIEANKKDLHFTFPSNTAHTFLLHYLSALVWCFISKWLLNGLAHTIIKDCYSIPNFQFGFLLLTELLFLTLPQCFNTADIDTENIYCRIQADQP